MDKIIFIYHKLNLKFLKQFGFNLLDVSIGRLAIYFHSARDSSSLAVTRILFGLAMLFDIPDERGGAVMDKRWGDPYMCHFPLLPFLQPLPMPYMAIVYTGLWFGAIGIMLGFNYRISAITFTLCYWYLFLIEKSFWNNHSYLFGIVAFLLAWCDAACFWSIDAYLNPSRRSETVSYWNYFILKYQFFILYFVAGLKKGTAEWLSGYSLPNLSKHWVFNPFKLFLSVPQIDYLIVHWFAFVFDLTVVFWMIWSRTRNLAMCFCTVFHLMNIRLFRIGMFPWVCLATMPLFYPFHWPKVVMKQCRDFAKNLTKIGCFTYKIVLKCIGYKVVAGNDAIVKDNIDRSTESQNDVIDDQTKELAETENKLDGKSDNASDEINSPMKLEEDTSKDKFDNNVIKNKLPTLLIIFFMFLQLFLPYSHFITKGYNNWTNGLYGYSWDMMVHTWETHSIVVKVVDNDSGKQYYLDPFLWTPNDRWTRHGDMLIQYAKCIEKNLMYTSFRNDGVVMHNISIFADIWFSMNNRSLQRMFDPRVDLLKAEWSPFKEISWLMPLVTAHEWRQTFDNIRDRVHSWGNGSDVLFVADFPGFYYENYFPPEFKNITLSVLKGQIIYESELANLEGESIILNVGQQILVDAGYFHKIINIGDDVTNYMYIFVNVISAANNESDDKSKLPLAAEVLRRIGNMYKFFWITITAVWQIIFQSAMWT